VQVCLAPAVPVPTQMHSWVLGQLLDQSGSDDFLALRARVNYPLLALKWSLIMLNEFVDVGRERRAFAGAPVQGRLVTQLAKANKMLTVAAGAMRAGPVVPHPQAFDQES